MLTPRGWCRAADRSFDHLVGRAAFPGEQLKIGTGYQPLDTLSDIFGLTAVLAPWFHNQLANVLASPSRPMHAAALRAIDRHLLFIDGNMVA